ncbi:MAG: threonine synthase [Opitutales bacterium]|nr:threonine synthase [Opitutales bacterium]|tara:strand:- start:293 stop:1654 length:1362 start_codon:yes stop_codon:yes gene_type:complete
MRYVSTRGESPAVGFTDAVALGLAPDGGLYLPESLPELSGKIRDWEGLPYPDLCFSFLKEFATDLDIDVLADVVIRSHQRFSHPGVAPLQQLEEDLYVLELFHGPTLAFKDFALQLLGNLYEEQIHRTGKPITVLGATSGDTGAAAIHGLLGKEGVNIFILYPEGRVSPLQERQMTCTGANNVFPLCIEGTFDDAQRALKQTFAEKAFKERVGLSAVNSINLARILAQSVYYLYAWLLLPEKKRSQTTFVVPTGNFGNVFAGWLLSKMGFAFGGFRVATNQNDVLHRLFETGVYGKGPVTPSHAPSMDIQVASNFERFLYYFTDCDPAKVREVMTAFENAGTYHFDEFNVPGFSSSRVSDEEITSIIRSVSSRHGYLIDPHTACAFGNLDDLLPCAVLSTAHPAKFPEVIGEAVGSEPKAPSLEELKERPIVKYPLEPSAEAIQTFILDHTDF